MTSPLDSCALCDNALSHHPIREGDKVFCCPGCFTVFNILSSQNQLSNYQDSPVFQQALRSGLISNPTLIEQMKRNRPEIPDNELEKLHLEISEMWCPSCAEIIRLIVLQEKGVRNCMVDYATDLSSIEFSQRHTSKERLVKLIQSIGYKAVTLDNVRKSVSFSLYLRFAVAAFCSLNIMMFAYPLYATYFDFDDQGVGPLFAWLSLGMSLPVIGYSAWPILRRFFGSLQVGLFGMETLVCIGVSTAFGLSLFNLVNGNTQVYFDSLTVIITFVLLGKIIETKAKFSAKNSLLHLARAMPRRGRKCFEDGRQDFVVLKEIYPGDTVAVFSGEKVVLDGVVVKGEGACDESLMTGEAIPIVKKIGSVVLSGSIVQQGALLYRVTSSAEQSTLHRIIDLVKQEIGHKTAYVRAADTIVRWFVPLVLAIAAATGLMCWLLGIADFNRTVGETAFIRAISVLLISCPCAIGIAAPLAESYVINKLVGLGAIVRNRGCLSLFGREVVFVFDKTGTITEGKFIVLSGLDVLSGDLCAILHGLAVQTTHPIANAIAAAIEIQGSIVSHVEEYAGMGVKGISEAGAVLLGSAEFLTLSGVQVPESFDCEEKGVTVVYFACNGKFVTRITLGDKIRQEAPDVVAALAPARVILLSGDAKDAVEKVAKFCGFDEWHAGCSPLRKREFIDKLRRKGHIVCMMGDGINDAPALTAADVGISVVTATDVSIQVSDLLLTTDKLSILPKILAIARFGQTIVNQNLFWAFCYNVIGIFLAVFGMLSPIFAAFAMVASSLMVLFNAQRIDRKIG